MVKGNALSTLQRFRFPPIILLFSFCAFPPSLSSPCHCCCLYSLLPSLFFLQSHCPLPVTASFLFFPSCSPSSSLFFYYCKSYCKNLSPSLLQPSKDKCCWPASWNLSCINGAFKNQSVHLLSSCWQLWHIGFPSW